MKKMQVTLATKRLLYDALGLPVGAALAIGMAVRELAPDAFGAAPLFEWPPSILAVTIATAIVAGCGIAIRILCWRRERKEELSGVAD